MCHLSAQTHKKSEITKVLSKDKSPYWHQGSLTAFLQAFAFALALPFSHITS